MDVTDKVIKCLNEDLAECETRTLLNQAYSSALALQLKNSEKDKDLILYCKMLFDNDFSFLDNAELIPHVYSGLQSINSEEVVLCILLSNPQISESFPFKARQYTFETCLEPLTIREQILLSFHMIYTYKSDECHSFRKINIQAYLDRLNFYKNELNGLIKRLCVYYDSLINNGYKDIEKELNTKSNFSDLYVFTVPLIFKYDLELQLAVVYKKNKLYEKALELFSKLGCTTEIVECLLILGKVNEAVCILKKDLYDLIENYTNKSVNDNNFLKFNFENLIFEFSKKALFSSISIKLGWLTKNTKYFDIAYLVCGGYEPLKQKGKYYFQQKKFKDACKIYKKCIDIVPYNEEVLFAYGSVNFVLNKYQECVGIFKKLINLNNKNIEYHRNLCLSYFYVEDLNNCKQVIKNYLKHDAVSLKLFCKLCIKTKDKEGLLWYLERNKNEDKTNLINFLTENGILTKQDFK